MFSKNVRTIYLYLVCLITLFLAVGGVISAIYETANLIFPTSYYATYQEDLKYDVEYEDLTGQAKIEYEQQYKEQWEKDNAAQLLRERNRNIKDIIYSLAFVVVALPIYAYNWRKIEEDKKQEQNTTNIESAGE